MPGSVESIAVSSVQSINAPLASRNRRVGRTEAVTAGVTDGCKSAFRDCADSPEPSAPAFDECAAEIAAASVLTAAEAD
jgi:hypothetical protein